MRLQVFFLVWLPAIFLVAGPSEAADDGSGVLVQGIVIDQVGEPVVGAQITSRGSVLGVTGPDGVFSFRLAPGPREIRVSHPAFQSLAQSRCPLIKK